MRRAAVLSCLRRQAVLPVCSFRNARTEAKGGVCMSDYELIMIILTFLTLLVAVDKKNRR